MVTLKFRLGDREIEMNADEAREIYGQLKLLFIQAGENPLVQPLPDIPGLVPSYPVVVPVPVRPIDWAPQPWPWPYETIITCGPNDAASLCIARA